MGELYQDWRARLVRAACWRLTIILSAQDS